MDILISSRNRDKIAEIESILRPLPVKLFTAHDFPDLPGIEEDEDTLLENAIKKARILTELTKMPTIADDTGLFIDALDGEPGIWSARYAGASCSYAANRNKVLRKMKGVSVRSARFETIAVLYVNDSQFTYAQGFLEGIIAEKKIGENGFGYDSIFIAENEKRTLAQMTSVEKNRISHRGKAFRSLAEKITVLLGA